MAGNFELRPAWWTSKHHLQQVVAAWLPPCDEARPCGLSSGAQGMLLVAEPTATEPALVTKLDLRVGRIISLEPHPEADT